MRSIPIRRWEWDLLLLCGLVLFAYENRKRVKGNGVFVRIRSSVRVGWNVCVCVHWYWQNLAFSKEKSFSPMHLAGCLRTRNTTNYATLSNVCAHLGGWQGKGALQQQGCCWEAVLATKARGYQIIGFLFGDSAVPPIAWQQHHITEYLQHCFHLSSAVGAALKAVMVTIELVWDQL